MYAMYRFYHLMLATTARLFSSDPTTRVDCLIKRKEEIDMIHATENDPMADRTPLADLSVALRPLPRFPRVPPIILRDEKTRWRYCICSLCPCGYPDTKNPASYKCTLGRCSRGDLRYCCETSTVSRSHPFPRMCGRRKRQSDDWVNDLLHDIDEEDCKSLDEDFPESLDEQINSGSSVRRPLFGDLIEVATESLGRFLVANNGRIWDALTDFVSQNMKQIRSATELQRLAEEREAPWLYYDNAEVEHAISLYCIRYARAVLKAYTISETSRRGQAALRCAEVERHEDRVARERERLGRLVEAANVLATEVEDELACEEYELFASSVLNDDTEEKKAPPSRSRTRLRSIAVVKRNVRRRLNMDNEDCTTTDEEKTFEPYYDRPAGPTPPFERSDNN